MPEAIFVAHGPGAGGKSLRVVVRHLLVVEDQLSRVCLPMRSQVAASIYPAMKETKHLTVPLGALDGSARNSARCIYRLILWLLHNSRSNDCKSVKGEEHVCFDRQQEGCAIRADVDGLSAVFNC
jgi:hypothetical protein